MTNSITRVSTWLNGKWVGQDSLGNAYYQQKRPSKHRKIKRWVIYAENDDASYVAPNWHRWLHHSTDELPKNNDAAYQWEKTPQPNLTGSSASLFPQGLPAKQAIEADYQPWQPSAHSVKFKGH